MHLWDSTRGVVGMRPNTAGALGRCTHAKVKTAKGLSNDMQNRRKLQQAFGAVGDSGAPGFTRNSCVGGQLVHNAEDAVGVASTWLFGRQRGWP